MGSRASADLAADVRAWTESGQARELRINAGYTQREAARLCEVTQAALHRWETAENSPRGRNLVTYHRWLKRLAARQAV